jgi:SHS2 domain-containing protein
VSAIEDLLLLECCYGANHTPALAFPGAHASFRGRGRCGRDTEASTGSFRAGEIRLCGGVYHWVEHAGELELRIEARSEEAVFADALTAFAELVGDDGGPESEQREIELEGDERDLLLVDSLNELVYLADAERFAPARLSRFELEGRRLRATVRGRRGDPRPLVKAVSLHDLEYEHDRDTGWRARLVLDV